MPRVNLLVLVALSAAFLSISARPQHEFAAPTRVEGLPPINAAEAREQLSFDLGRPNPIAFAASPVHVDLAEHPRIQKLLQDPASSPSASAKKVELLKRQNSSTSNEPSTVAAFTTTVVAFSTTFVFVTTSSIVPLSTENSILPTTSDIGQPPPSSSSIIVIPPNTSAPDTSGQPSSIPVSSAPGTSAPVAPSGPLPSPPSSLLPIPSTLEIAVSTASASLIDVSQTLVIPTFSNSANSLPAAISSSLQSVRVTLASTAISRPISASGMISSIASSHTALNENTAHATMTAPNHQVTTAPLTGPNRAGGGVATALVLITTTLPNGQKTVLTTYVVVPNTGVGGSGGTGKSLSKTVDASLQSGVAVPRKAGNHALILVGGVLGGAMLL